MGLQEALDRRRDASRERLPQEALDAMDAGVAAAAAGDLVERALPVGARLPVFTLPDASLSTAERHALSFPVLSDVGNTYARELGLVHPLGTPVRDLYEQWGFDLAGRNDGHDEELPLPATYVVAQDGTVTWRFVDPDYGRRAEPDDVLAALGALSSGR